MNIVADWRDTGRRLVLIIAATRVFPVVLLLSACDPTSGRGLATTATLVVSTAASALGGAATAAGNAVGVAGKTLGGKPLKAEVAESQPAAAEQNTAALDQAGVEALGRRIGQLIVDGMLFCTTVKKTEYRIDCLADQLAQVSAGIPADDDFEQARSIIADASEKLDQVARSRPSRTLRPAVLNSVGPKPGSSRPINPVETADLPVAIEEAEQIIEQAEVLLLRSAEVSERRKVAYERMAEAIGSTKVLLRSS